MRDVAVVAFAQTRHSSADQERNEVEMLAPVLTEAVERAGIARQSIDFTCSGSCDYLAAAPFSFVSALDAVGAWPPISESHVEMDAAWALYEAWVRLQHGDMDTALVYGFGKSSQAELADIMSLQLDPYYVAPMWPDQISLAALQARAFLEATGTSDAELAEVTARSRAAGAANSHAVPFGTERKDPAVVAPLRSEDCPPITDGAAAIVLAAGDAARDLVEYPAWISGIAHRIEPHALGVRDLSRSASTEQAARAARVSAGPVDVAELHAQFSHEEPILRAALGLDAGTTVNPSGGPLAANPVMATGLIRIGEAAHRVHAGTAHRAVAHASSGPCLQHNLVCVLEGD